MKHRQHRQHTQPAKKRTKARTRTALIILSVVALVAALGVGVAASFYNLERAARRRHVDEAPVFSTVYGNLHKQNGQAVRFNNTILLCGEACFNTQATIRGEFAFNRIPPGDYRLYAVHNECKSNEQTLVIEEGVFNTLNAPLRIDQC